MILAGKTKPSLLENYCNRNMSAGIAYEGESRLSVFFTAGPGVNHDVGAVWLAVEVRAQYVVPMFAEVDHACGGSSNASYFMMPATVMAL